jgi:hypothetical protein
MKLLVLAVDGNEAGFPALTSFLDQIGIPYDAVKTASQPLPALTGLNGNGNYQGIILTVSNLAGALSDAGWQALDDYTYNFGVRTVAYYGWPGARYGLVAGATICPAAWNDPFPTSVNFTTDAGAYFPYLNRTNPISVTYACTNLASTVAAAGEITTPLITYNGYTVAAYHKDASGREYLAQTFDNNPYLLHSMALNYGLFNWVTKGLFLGSRKIYFSPQFDDLFIPDIMYNSSSCPQIAFQTDPTVTDPAGCKEVRLTGADLTAVANWQTAQVKDPQLQIKLSFPFNGIGTTAAENSGDATLATVAKSHANTFFWLSHTWDHANLDCYTFVDDGGIKTCVAANSTQSAAEITQNNKLATSMKLNYDSQSMVSPNVSGLKNPAFMQAAVANKIQYLVCDGAAADCNPTSGSYPYLPLLPPNTGVANSLQPSVLEIPRHATNIFYNATTDLSFDGSESDEYNFFYGPGGVTPTFPTQTWPEIRDREAGNILGFMLRYDAAPLMFHQSNLAWKVLAGKSLFTDLTEDLFGKFKALTNLPVISLSQTSLGQLMKERAAYNASGVAGVLTPGVSFTLTTKTATKVPVTGVCQSKASCQAYGGQNISTLNLATGGTMTVKLP